MATTSTVPTKYWHVLDDGRVQCDVCPRACKLHEGQRGVCFVRAREHDQIVLTTWGRSSGFCQNCDISKSKEVDTLADQAEPETIARAAHRLGARSVAFTYNDPVVF